MTRDQQQARNLAGATENLYRNLKILRSVYLSGSQPLVFCAIRPALPVCAREKFQFHVSNRFSPAFIRLGCLGLGLSLLLLLNTR